MPVESATLNRLRETVDGFVVRSGKGIEDYNVGDPNLSIHAMRSYDWDPIKNESNGCFRVHLTVVSTEVISLDGVSLFVYDNETGQLLRSGDLRRSKDRQAEHWVIIDQLPFGKTVRFEFLETPLPEEEKDSDEEVEGEHEQQ